MTCTRSTEDIQALTRRHARTDPRRRAREHLDECDACRAARARPAADPRRRRDARRSGTARSRLAADRGTPPPGRPRARPAGSRSRPRASSTSGWRSPPRSSSPSARPSSSCCRSFYSHRTAPSGTAQQGNAAGADAVQSGVEDLRQAERLLQSGIAKLKEGLGSDEQALPADVASTLDLNLQILDQAIADSSARRAEGTAERGGAQQPL